MIQASLRKVATARVCLRLVKALLRNITRGYVAQAQHVGNWLRGFALRRPSFEVFPRGVRDEENSDLPAFGNTELNPVRVAAVAVQKLANVVVKGSKGRPALERSGRVASARRASRTPLYHLAAASWSRPVRPFPSSSNPSMAGRKIGDRLSMDNPERMKFGAVVRMSIERLLGFERMEKTAGRAGRDRKSEQTSDTNGAALSTTPQAMKESDKKGGAR